MSQRATFPPKVIMMRTEEQRKTVLAWVTRMPLYPEQPYRVVIDDPMPAKSREQEQLYHALIGDIAQQYRLYNMQWDAEDMKRLLLDQFRRESMKVEEFKPLWLNMGEMRMVPSIDGTGFVWVGEVKSRRFPAKLAGLFIEYLYQFGAEVGVKFTNPKPEGGNHANES